MNAPVSAGPIRLTSFSHGGGCGCKIAPGLLSEILRNSNRMPVPPQLLVGIETADDAWERITAGASLLQGYTGFVYGGGLWAKHIHDGLARHLRAAGFTTLAEAVGSASG